MVLDLLDKWKQWIICKHPLIFIYYICIRKTKTEVYMAQKEASKGLFVFKLKKQQLPTFDTFVPVIVQQTGLHFVRLLFSALMNNWTDGKARVINLISIFSPSHI